HVLCVGKRMRRLSAPTAGAASGQVAEDLSFPVRPGRRAGIHFSGSLRRIRTSSEPCLRRQARCACLRPSCYHHGGTVESIRMTWPPRVPDPFAAEITGFLAAIADEADSVMPRLVFADWLEDHGDPRATLVRLQAQQLDPTADETTAADLVRQVRAW